jgi:hypothetical protein
MGDTVFPDDDRETALFSGGDVGKWLYLGGLGNVIEGGRGQEVLEPWHLLNLLEESVSYLEQALSLVAHGTSRWGQLASNLGNALVAVFRATGGRVPLQQARELFEEAAGTLVGSWDHGVCLSNPAACLQELHEQTGEIALLDEAIEVFRATVDESAGSAVPERRQRPLSRGGTSSREPQTPPIPSRPAPRYVPAPLTCAAVALLKMSHGWVPVSTFARASSSTRFSSASVTE